MTRQSFLRDIVDVVESIPMLPAANKYISKAIDDPDLNIQKLASVVEQDVAVAATLLKIANSPLYGSLGQIKSIKHAISFLGLKEVKAIILGCSVKNFFTRSENGKYNQNSFWKHAIVCSQLAKHLAFYFQVEESETIFLSGLIHDIGKLLFAMHFPDDFAKIIELIESENISMSSAEKKIVGVTHYQIGAKLLQHWNFPRQIVYQVYYHHAPWASKQDRDGSTLIYLADLISKYAGYPFIAQKSLPDFQTLIQTPNFRFISQHGFEIDEKFVINIKQNVLGILSQESNSIFNTFAL